MANRVDLTGLQHLLGQAQDGVVARRQLLDLGADDADVARLLRRRELTTAAPGVYLDHTGRPTRAQQEWIAVLGHWPAALARDSALPAAVRAARPALETLLHVAVARDRGGIRALPGVRVHRTPDLGARVAWQRRPPRVRLEHAVLDVACDLLARDRIADAFDVLARTCHTRTTTPDRVRAVLAERPRVAGRRLLTGLLLDLAAGSCSELERGYLHRVERAHRLPVGERQVRQRADGRTSYVDVKYRYRTVVELDGRAFHDGPSARDRDARRDLAHLTLDGAVTARVTWSLVYDSPCATASQVARLLRQGGWTGHLQPCEACRTVA